MMSLRSPVTWLAFVLPAVSGCTPDPPRGAYFAGRAREAGLDFQHTDGSSGQSFIVETLASGVLLFDYDLDGDLDIYFPSGRALPPTPETIAATRNALYRNDGGLRFTDVTSKAGVPGTGFGIGGAAADYDGDGDLDLYLCQYGSNALYRNEGKAREYAFTEVIAEAGVDDDRFSAGAVFFDLDRDGDLDLYVSNYCAHDFTRSGLCRTNGVPGYCPPSHYEPAGHSRFLNRGDGTFDNITASSGIEAGRGRGMGVVATDLDDDGWLDLYVANDGSGNFLWHNQRNGTFKDIALDAGVALSADGDEQGSMGVDAADFNRDGRLDVFVTNYQKQLNALYRADAPGYFVDVGMGQGIGETCLPLVSWGTKWFDYDHDGWLDLFIANGHLEDNIHRYDQSSTYKQRNQLFRNTGGGVMLDVTDTAGEGLREVLSSRGAAFGDLDGDGDVDIVVSNSRERPSLLVNEGAKGNWIILDLRGRKNRFAVGARARMTAGSVSQIAEVHAGSSYVSQNDLRLHFGLGASRVVERAEIRWPEGHREVFVGLEAGRVHRIIEGSGTAVKQ